ncbi:hypothetical protein OOK58_42980 [Streptomyces sp. NBC_01728]|uniref:hypothetical protein n=1 Tax=unclassified Streptomyces TaxID=2593676 RepID=UPI0022573461|nr:MULTISPECIES: hypothetical protein [unclassified Streptomyces]MCX4458677.1 hypothetical protein [Streptomyces sp. NBC_01719]MCX4498034.1 hypothetical protein [Streptomyces sp. NBC_01728]
MSGTSGSVSVASTDAEYEILCDVAANGTSTPFLRHYTTSGSGTPAMSDTLLDGTTPYTPTGSVVRCGTSPNPQIDSTVQRQTGAGTVTIAAGARSVTLVVYAGSPTVALSGGTAVPIAAGSSLTWSVDQGGKSGEALQDSFVFMGIAGADFVVLSTREL